MLQTQDLRVDQKSEPYIGLTRENLIKNSVITNKILTGCDTGAE